MLVNTIFEEAVDQILDVSRRFGAALEEAGLPYRVIGGLSTYLHVEAVDPLAARLTRDVDVAIRCDDLGAIRVAVEPHGFVYRHVAGGDMFLDKAELKARSAVHVAFIDEKVRPEYAAPIPGSQPVRSRQGVWICSVADLVTMKLTSYRLKDKVHVQDLDKAGLITPDVEAVLPEVLKARLAEVRAQE